jgi:hypothetical protein
VGHNFSISSFTSKRYNVLSNAYLFTAVKNCGNRSGKKRKGKTLNRVKV